MSSQPIWWNVPLKEIITRRITTRATRHTDFFRSGVYMPKTCDISGVTVLIDGAIATFGAAFRFGQHYWMHFEIFDESARAAFLLHRIGLDMMASYDALGFPAVYSTVDSAREKRAERWHEALGFVLVPEADKDDEIRLCEEVSSWRAWVRRPVGRA